MHTEAPLEGTVVAGIGFRIRTPCNRGYDHPHVTVPVDSNQPTTRIQSSELWDPRHTMVSQTTVDTLSTGVDQLNISGRRSPEYMMDGNNVVFMPKVSIRKLVELPLRAHIQY